jgi:hypothetical protein
MFNFYGYDSANPFNGGKQAAFLLNGFDLKGASGQHVTIQAMDLNNSPISGLKQTIILDGTWDSLHKIDWAGVGSIEFTDVGSGISMDNVEINDQVSAPVPEPGTIMLLGAGMFGLAIYCKYRRDKRMV